MSDSPRKKRMNRAKVRLTVQLRAEGYTVIPSDNNPVCIIAYRSRAVDKATISIDELRVIRICLDAASASDKALMRPYKCSPGASVELFISRLRAHGFSVTRV